VAPPEDRPPDTAPRPAASGHGTDAHPDTERSVRRALARLAVRPAPAGDGGDPSLGDRQDRPPAAVVRAAEDAAADLQDAAAFRDDGGLGRLRRAVDRATAAGDVAVARRGQRVLAAFERVDRATVDDPPVDDPPADDPLADDPPANDPPVDDPPADAGPDHVHTGRGTPLGAAVEDRHE